MPPASGSRAETPQRGRAERALREDLVRRLRGRVGGGLVAREAVGQRDERRQVVQRGLGVERPDLHRAHARMGPQLPPEPRVVRHVGGARQPRAGAAEVAEVAHRARDGGARPAAHGHLARRREPGVAPVAEGGVGGQRLQERQVAPEAVEGADGGVGVRHAHVDVGAADGVGARVAQEVADALVALLVGDAGRALGRGGMRARAQEPGARRQRPPGAARAGRRSPRRRAGTRP